MCLTCEDPSSTNAKLCGPARVARAEKAYRVVDYKRQGKTYPWIAEEMGMGLATAHKLFRLGVKQMAPPGAVEEMQVALMQLEQIYADIMDTLADTTDPTEKARLFSVAQQNIEQRRKMYGGADLTVKHTLQTQFDADIEELHKAFDRDQDIRNQTRAERRTAGR